MVTVKLTDDIFSTLYALHLAEKNPVLRTILIKETQKERVEHKKDMSSKFYLCDFFDLKERTIQDRLFYLESEGYIQKDMSRSYRVTTKKEKTYKWVFTLTSQGRLWLKSNLSIESYKLLSDKIEKHFWKVRDTLTFPPKA